MRKKADVNIELHGIMGGQSTPGHTQTVLTSTCPYDATFHDNCLDDDELITLFQYYEQDVLDYERYWDGRY